MTLTSTIYNFDISLADVDRGVYETLAVRAALHPSESLEYLAARVLAYCLEYEEGITFSKGGVSDGDQPPLWVPSPDGGIKTWIEIGLPSAERLHRGHTLAGRAVVYTHRGIPQVLGELNGHGIHRAGDIPVVAFDRAFVTALGESLDRRSTMSLSVTEGQLYVDVGDRHFESQLATHRLTP